VSLQNIKRTSLGFILSLCLLAPTAWAENTSDSFAQAESIPPESKPIVERGERSIVLSAHQKNLIIKAEETFNAIQSMTARFMQSATTGDYAEGTVYLFKPGRLRIEYDPPVPVLVIANNAYFTFIDKEMDQRSFVSLDATPAGVLLRKSVDLTDDDIRVVDVQEGPGVAIIVVTSKTDPTAGNLSLVFSKKPFAFKQWQVTDAQGITTTVTLQDMKTGVKLDPKLFVVPKAS